MTCLFMIRYKNDVKNMLVLLIVIITFLVYHSLKKNTKVGVNIGR